MAEKRMISKVISISKKFNLRLNDHFSRLLYLLLIPHADDFGRLTGDPYKIKALILPMMDEVNWQTVEGTLEKLHNAELIILFESDGEKYIQIINFDDHQQGLHKRTRSKLPEPPSVSRKFPEIPPEQNRTEGNRTEENGTEKNGVLSDEKDKVRLWLQEYNVECRGVTQLEDAEQYVGKMDIEVIEHCIKLAKGKHVPYLLTIFQRHINEGKTTRDSIRSLRVVHDRKRDAELEARDEEIARNQWISAGGDPSEFRYKPASGD